MSAPFEIGEGDLRAVGARRTSSFSGSQARTMTIILDDRHDITLDVAVRVGWRGEPVGIAAAALARMAACARRVRAADRRPGGGGLRRHLRLRPACAGAGCRWRSGCGTPATRPCHAGERGCAVPGAGDAADGARPARELPGRPRRRAARGRGQRWRRCWKARCRRVPREGAVCAGEILPLSWLFGDLVAAFEPREKEVLALLNGAPVAAALVADGALAARGAARGGRAGPGPRGRGLPGAAGPLRARGRGLVGRPGRARHRRGAERADRRRAPERRPYQAPVSFRTLPKTLGRLRREAGACGADRRDLAGPGLGQPGFPAAGRRAPGRPRALDRRLPQQRRLAGAAGPGRGLRRPVHRCRPDDRPPARRRHLGPARPARAVASGAVTISARWASPPSATARPPGARRRAVFLPGSESGGFVQNDLAVPTALAWEGQETAGRLLDRALAAVAIVASQALAVTGREAPPALAPHPRRPARGSTAAATVRRAPASSPRRRQGCCAPASTRTSCGISRARTLGGASRRPAAARSRRRGRAAGRLAGGLHACPGGDRPDDAAQPPGEGEGGTAGQERAPRSGHRVRSAPRVDAECGGTPTRNRASAMDRRDRPGQEQAAGERDDGTADHHRPATEASASQPSGSCATMLPA